MLDTRKVVTFKCGGIDEGDEWKKIKSRFERLIGIDYYHS